MGGHGSGKQGQFNPKPTVDNYQSVDIRDWHRRRFLFPGTTFTNHWNELNDSAYLIQGHFSNDLITLQHLFKINNRWVLNKHAFVIDWTSCHLGGKRPWFICPTPLCQRRVAILYLGKVYACRRCYNLAYPGQRERHDERATRRANKLRTRLNWMPGLLNKEGSKPQGMHWRTFQRLRMQCAHFTEKSLVGAAMRLKRSAARGEK